MEVDSEAALLGVLRDFFVTPVLLHAAEAFVAELLEWFEEQRELAFYASSILLVYDSSSSSSSSGGGGGGGGGGKPGVHAQSGGRPMLRAKMIDFAHVHSPGERCVAGARAGKALQPSGQDDSYITGLRALQRLLEAV